MKVIYVLEEKNVNIGKNYIYCTDLIIILRFVDLRNRPCVNNI